MVPARTELEVLLVGSGLQEISAVATIIKLVVVCNADLLCFCAESGLQPLFVGSKNSAESMVYLGTRAIIRAPQILEGACAIISRDKNGIVTVSGTAVLFMLFHFHVLY